MFFVISWPCGEFAEMSSYCSGHIPPAAWVFWFVCPVFGFWAGYKLTNALFRRWGPNRQAAPATQNTITDEANRT